MKNATPAMGAYVFLGGLFLLLSILGNAGVPRLIFKGTLMPALGFWLYLVHGHLAPFKAYLSIVFAWAGDIFLAAEPAFPRSELPFFLLGMSSFLLMQLCYIIGIRNLRPHFRGIHWGFFTFYLFLLISLSFTVTSQMGELLVPVAVYSVFLAGMALHTAGVSVKMGLGGFIFFISDLCIALDRIDSGFPHIQDFVMLTYLVAQYMIISEWSRLIILKAKTQ